MADLSGSLENIPLHAFVGLLSDLKKSGDALLLVDEWSACLSFEDGRLIGAAIERDEGPAALHFMTVAMGRADLEFWQGEPTLQPNLNLTKRELAQYAQLAPAPWSVDLPRPDAVPFLVPGPPVDDSASETSPIPLTRSTVDVLLAVDGHRTVQSLAWQFGLERSLRALVGLRDADLITFEPPPRPASALELEAAPEVDSEPLVDAPAAPQLDSDVGLRLLPVAVAARLRRLTARVPLRGAAVELVQTLVVSAVLVVTVHAVIENFRIDGTSMQPTFASGEALIVNRTAYLLSGGPQRGDVVVFRAPPEPDTDYIKRVIGLPGESILVQHGRVFVNGQALDEPYVHFPANYQFPGNGEPVTIPQGTYFVLGDNRPDSFDSHTGWVVPNQNLIGRAWLRYWPPAAWGVVASGSWSLEPSESASNPNQ